MYLPYLLHHHAVLMVMTVFMIFSLSPTNGLQIHIAPMQGYTDRHVRYFFRLLSPHVILWTEMLKAKELISASHFQQFNLLNRGRERDIVDGVEGYCVLQFGGDNENQIVEALKIARPFGYSQYDLNCGCPSIQTNANYGAALMKRADDVATLVDRMSFAIQDDVPLSIKCRLGAHDHFDPDAVDDYETLSGFVTKVTASGSVSRLVVHARRAVLQGLSPASNRQAPPLRHDLVHRLAREHPHLHMVLNGGLSSLDDITRVRGEGPHLRGVMAGRWAIQRPFDVLNIDAALFGGAARHGNKSLVDLKKAAVWKYCSYASQEMATNKRDQHAAVLFPMALVAEALAKEFDELTGLEEDGDDERSGDGDGVGFAEGSEGAEGGPKELEWVRIGECCEVMWAVVEATVPLLVQANALSKLDVKALMRASTEEVDVWDARASHLALPVPLPPFRRFRRALQQACGKKIISKMRSNCRETIGGTSDGRWTVFR